MNIYQFLSYRIYLQANFQDPSYKKKKSELAEFLNCHPGFISQALSIGKTHFTPEHIYKIAQFFKLDESETNYLILLLQYEKAGSVELKNHFKSQLTKIQNENQEITSKIKKTERKLSEYDKAIYYSHWAYMGIHIAISLPNLNTVKALNDHFKIDKKFLNSILEFLIETELIEKKANKLLIGKTRIHLDRNSALIKSLHQNWRQKAIESLVDNDEINLHYSSVLALSKKDVLKIRTLILDLIKEKETILIPSPEEEVIVFNVDYFKL